MLRLFATYCFGEVLAGGPFSLSRVRSTLPLFVLCFRDRRETVSTPFPKQLESSGLNREFSAFVSCLEDIPSMQEVRVV